MHIFIFCKKKTKHESSANSGGWSCYVQIISDNFIKINVTDGWYSHF